MLHDFQLRSQVGQNYDTVKFKQLSSFVITCGLIQVISSRSSRKTDLLT